MPVVRRNGSRWSRAEGHMGNVGFIDAPYKFGAYYIIELSGVVKSLKPSEKIKPKILKMLLEDNADSPLGSWRIYNWEYALTLAFSVQLFSHRRKGTCLDAKLVNMSLICVTEAVAKMRNKLRVPPDK